MLWVAIGLAFIGISVAVLLGIMLRGAIRMHGDDLASYKVTQLSGREIEVLRRQAINTGMSSIRLHDVLDLITTLNMIQLGNYEDKDPYVPADPYAGLEP